MAAGGRFVKKTLPTLPLLYSPFKQKTIMKFGLNLLELSAKSITFTVQLSGLVHVHGHSVESSKVVNDCESTKTMTKFLSRQFSNRFSFILLLNLLKMGIIQGAS